MTDKRQTPNKGWTAMVLVVVVAVSALVAAILIGPVAGMIVVGLVLLLVIGRRRFTIR